MTALQDKLRAALRETADEIPAQAPPLDLSPQRRASRDGRNARWGAWAAPLGAAALVLAAVGASLAVAGNLTHQPVATRPQAGPGGVPAYYVALITAKPQSDVANDLGSSSLTYSAAELRSTQTGAVLARITPPKPYVSFTGVSGAAGDRTFVLSAQGRQPSVWPPYPAQRFFLLRIDPAARAGARMTLTALPAGYVPAGYGIRDMALSPDGTHLAAQIGDSLGYAEELDVFDLATRTERAWSTRTCAECAPNGGGNLWMGVNTDALSWTADSQHVAFTWENTVRLLDTRAAGSDILTDSKTVATWTGGVTGLNQWRGAIITPDGRTVLGIEQLAGMNLKGPIREHLVSWSAATGQQIAVLNNLNARDLGDYEQILYTSTDGRLLVLTYQQPGAKAAIVHDGRSTPIPWSPHIGAAAW
ncbi:MAG TPA: hypothetical protein VK284_14180 [Streptosporangiaceae bacterium]|nr:hypothetical protein [Streptosporangiaceae bacterium]